MGDINAEAGLILKWSDRFIANVDTWLLALQAGTPLTVEALAELKDNGLVGGNGRPTSLALRLTQALLRREWQAGDEQFQGLMEAAGLGPGAHVLDVGCSIGHTLCFLAAYHPAESIGVDVDLEALALGCRLAKRSGREIGLVHATGYSLPLADRSFSHVICRNSLTYMHQARALSEMIRVLKPGGYLYLRFEIFWYDLQILRHAPGLREFACRVRDLHLGLLSAVSGRQPTPGGRWRGGRAFATARSLKVLLRRLDCRVARVEESIRCPTCFGRPTQTTLLAQKARGVWIRAVRSSQ
jgi:SAM-dependent methyltransferase